jgi:methylenetetrahydrofolate reductase (NADPH)
MDRTVPQLLAETGRPTLSLEFFPPKTPLDFGVLGGSIERMRPVKPDFTTCTYGAGGSTREFSFAAWELLRRMDFTPVVAHLTCVGATREDLEGQVDRIWEAGIRNIMALRGDPPRGEEEFRAPEGGLAHASELVALVKARHPDICCGVGGYPETHPESASPEEDVRHLKEKLDAGAEFVNTQLFFDNDAYFRFRDRCDAAGIRAPLFPGLMPVATPGQLRRAVGLSRASIPAALERGLAERGEGAGMEWLIAQIRGLVAGGAPGIHLYILNKANTLLDPRLAACLAEWRR